MKVIIDGKKNLPKNILLFSVLTLSLVFLFSSFEILPVYAPSESDPSVLSKSVSDDLISDSDADDTFDAVVTFNEPMNAGAIPTITFLHDVSSTLAFSSGVWTDGNTVYTAIYDVIDDNVTEPHITFTVSDAEDAANNPQNSDDVPMDYFAIDTENPTVSIGYLDDDNFSTDLYAKSGTVVTLTATFSESVNDPPQISISGANILLATDMLQTSTTVYTYDYTITSGDGIATVAIAAQDLAGNSVESPTGDVNFNVDNTPPTGTISIDRTEDRKSTRLNSSHIQKSRMPSSA